MDTHHDPDESDLNQDNHEEEHAIDTNPPSRPDEPTAISFQQRKWNRFRSQYNDQYLDLFKTTFDPAEDHLSNGDLPPTQLGAVTWHAGEKAKLYQALCRKGRLDLRALADIIGSKSVVEVNAYLDNLREHETDRQRFEAQPKNVSHADIPAAVEIGPQCEAMLEGAADALLAFQEQYDHVAGQQRNDLWLISHDIALKLDEQMGDGEIEAEVSDPKFAGQVISISNRAMVLFRLAAFLELSERLFMNKGSDHPDSWQNIAEEGERPSLTLDTVSLLYDLTVNFLRRLVQSCLFITQSRIRASTSRDYRPSGIVKTEDVVAALDVLGVNSNTGSYWVELARRNDLKVVDDAHRRGVDAKVVLAYDDVEESLSQSGRSRSVSAAPKARLENSTSDDDSDSSVSMESEDDPSDNSEEDSVQSSDLEIPPDGEMGPALTHDSQAEDDVGQSERQSNVRISQSKKLHILEVAHDEYLERMDQGARQQEELRLLSFLGAENATKIKEENLEGLGVRPREFRKSIEDCAGLDVIYEAEWEPRVKRRRLNAAEQ